jgi:hypothetical protein
MFESAALSLVSAIIQPRRLLQLPLNQHHLNKMDQ